MERLFYKDLMEWKNNKNTIPFMVIGSRQIGKTYLIDEFCKNEFNDYIYINLMERNDLVEMFESNYNFETKVNNFELMINKTIKKDTVIFFDEIQESESLICMLKAFCESEFPYKIICAGSLLGVKLKRFKKSFPVGKVIIKHMYPMNFEEFLMNVESNKIVNEIKRCFDTNSKMEEHLHTKLLDLYKIYLYIGGMPASVKDYIDMEKKILEIDKDIIESIYHSYVADMKKYVKNDFEQVKIERVYKSMPSQLAKDNKKFKYSIVEKNARKRDYESSIDWLLSSNLLIPVYFVNECQSPLKATLDYDTFKLYYNDVGILTRILELSPNKILLESNYRFEGILAENFVITELTSNNISLYYWAKNQVAEIDVIIESNDNPIPIEVKAGENKKSRSLNYYIEKNKPKMSYRISANNFGFVNGIKSIPLYATFCIKK